MTINFTGKILAGYLTAFILLLFSYTLTFYTTRQLSAQNRLLNHTSDVINNLELLNSDIKDVTVGVRGYFIMQDSKFLLPYFTAKRNVDSVYNLVLGLTADNTLQQQRLLQLDTLIKRKFDIAESSIHRFRNDPDASPSSIAELTLISKNNSDSIRNLIGQMQIRENELQKERGQKVSATSRAILFVNIASLSAAILLVIYSVITINVQTRAKSEADNRAAAYRQQLEERIIELDALNKELTELKAMEKFAISGRIARAIAHEVRNPLTNIGLAGEQINAQIKADGEAVELIEMINRNVNRINQLITDLLNSSKFGELNCEYVSANDVLDEAIELASDRIQLKHVRVEKKYANQLKKVSVDREKMKIAFLNIIVNAIEAMPNENAVLALTTVEKNDNCIITIADNGIGMDRDTLSKLFEPYFTTKLKGNGLGLTNTQNIIMNHKGSVEVKSELGKGTSFIVYLQTSAAVAVD